MTELLQIVEKKENLKKIEKLLDAGIESADHAKHTLLSEYGVFLSQSPVKKIVLLMRDLDEHGIEYRIGRAA